VVVLQARTSTSGAGVVGASMPGFRSSRAASKASRRNQKPKLEIFKIFIF